MVTIHWEMAMQNSLSEQYPHLAAYRERMYQEPSIGELYRVEFQENPA